MTNLAETIKSSEKVEVYHFGLQPYERIFKKMKLFTKGRNHSTDDQIWLLQHPPVFTQGQAGKKEHILQPGNTPIIQSDRGGQVTYHGPGQLIIYLLVDLKRKQLNVKQFVYKMESAVINLLASYSIKAHAKAKAPGVYVNNAKICSLGIRVSRGCTYHGLALNVNMDLEPFSRINPCGYHDLKITQFSDLCNINLLTIQQQLLQYLITEFGYQDYDNC